MVIVGGAHFGGGELSDGIEASEKRLYSIRTPGFQWWRRGHHLGIARNEEIHDQGRNYVNEPFNFLSLGESEEAMASLKHV